MKTKIIRLKPLTIAFAFILSIIAVQFGSISTTFAAPKTWDGSAGDNKFSTAANWSGDTIPVTGDTIIFSGQAGGNSGDSVLLNNDLTGVAFAGITLDTRSTNVQKSFHLNTITFQAGATISEAAIGGGGSNAATDYFNFSTNSNDGYYLAVDGTVNALGNLTVTTQSGLAAGVVTVAGNLTVSRGVISTASNISGTVITPNGNAGLSYRGASRTISNNFTIGALSGYPNQSSLLFADCTGSYTNGRGESGNLILCDEYATRTYTLTGTLTLNDDVTIGIAPNATVRIEGTINYNGHTITKSTKTTGNGVLQIVTPPSAPTDLIATPASGSVGLEWEVPSSNGYSSITDYVVEYKLHSSSSWSTFADGTGTGTTTSITGLTNGSAYDFRVSAVNSKGASPFATINSITPTATLTVPLAVSGITGTVDATTKNLHLNWTAPASNGGSPITNYLVEAKLSSGSTWYTVAHPASDETAIEIFSGLTDGQTYDFRISAINAQGTGPSTTLSNYVYTAGNGSEGNLSEASGSVVGAPNTGTMKLSLKNPLVIAVLGIVAAAAILFFAKSRRRA